ncbi:MAG: tetratricopeptide repeat protein [candidate division KSB1 bacterium]|nr:tetratricopeptide repeat protein [candidate division KSB1 bacterium]
MDLKRFADAGQYFEKSYHLAKEIGDVHLQANVKLNRSRLYLEINDLMLVNVLCHQALTVFRKLGDHLGESDVFRYMGILYTRRKNWQKAQLYLKDSLDMAQKYQSPLNEAESYLEFAHFYRAKEDKEQTVRQYKQAEKLFKKINLNFKAEQVSKELSEFNPH